LGGPGKSFAGHDTLISGSTVLTVRLAAIDGEQITCDYEWAHKIRNGLGGHRMVIFATDSSEISDLIPSARKEALYESWLLRDDVELEDFDFKVRHDLRVGISYRDEDGALHVVAPTHIHAEEVPLRDFSQYIDLPGGVDIKELRIMSIDLYDLADPDHVVTNIEGLDIRVAVRSDRDPSFVSWTAPFPCYLERIHVDLGELALPGRSLESRVRVFTLRTPGFRPLSEWTKAEVVEAAVESWVLPGHGVIIEWRDGK
jgi:hypothetical protein